MFGAFKQDKGFVDNLHVDRVTIIERKQELLDNPKFSDEIRHEIEWLANESYFKRPRGGWLGWVSKLPGPMPAIVVAPVKSELEKVQSHRFAAFMTVVSAIAALIYLSANYRSLAISPMSLLFDLSDRLSGGQWWGTLIACFVLIVAMMTAFRSDPRDGVYGGKFLDHYAAREELWFRAGAENWSTFQRIRSCVGFGLVHVVNMFYPITSIAVIMLVGGVFMAVYLRAYKRTGSTKLAALESTRFHAAYNRFAFMYLFVAVGIAVYASQS